MRNHIWNGTHSVEIDPYPELRQLLAPELAGLPPEEIESVVDALYGGEVSAEDLESFWKKLGKVAKTALPVATTALGTAFGGPVGGMLGGAAGQAISGAIGGAKKGRRPSGRRILAGLAKGIGPAGGLSGGAKGGAAAQLLRTISRPDALRALGSMALGPAGKRHTPVAGVPVPVSAFANLLGVLANQAAGEFHEIASGEASGTPAYLLDDHGEALGDPFDATSRAEVLLARLAEADALEAAESDGYFDHQPEAESVDESWEEAIESEEEFWTELALAEAEEE
jgi:hypothetical protein